MPDVPTWVVNFCWVALCIRLWRMRMWMTYTAFAVYVFAATVLALIPNPTWNQELWRALWVWLSTPVTLLLAIALIEVLWFAMLEFEMPERKPIIGALAALYFAVLLSGFILHRNAAIAPLVTARQFSKLALAITGLLGSLYIWSRDIPLEKNTGRHLILMVSMLVARAGIGAMDRKTGIWKLCSQADLIIVSKYMHAAFCILWIFLLQTPHRHWWELPTRGPEAFPGARGSRPTPHS